MENIEEYLKYYVGQKCMVMTRSGERETEITLFAIGRSDVKPILKKLSDMTEEDAERLIRLKWEGYEESEVKEVTITHYSVSAKWWSQKFEEWLHVFQLFGSLNANQLHYLLSKGYWLWDQSAFTSGLILDAKNVKY